jgi:hypothetical protein
VIVLECLAPASLPTPSSEWDHSSMAECGVRVVEIGVPLLFVLLLLYLASAAAELLC